MEGSTDRRARVTGRRLDEIKVVFSGAGAAALATANLFVRLGVPREHLAEVKRMSDDMALFVGSSRVAAEKYDTAEAATQEMAAYFRDLIEQRRRQPTADLLSEPGERDLTAHVDLTALRRAAAAAGLEPVAQTNQAAFIAGAGLESELDRVRRGPDATLEGAIALRSALAHLMNPRSMGGFAVELFASGAPERRRRIADRANPLPGAAAPNRPLV